MDIQILDITSNQRYEKLLYKCLSPIPFRKYRKRREYLESAIPKGFRKKFLFLNAQPVGQIEYAPAEACGYPIFGEKLVVMNCIWVLRKAKGHNFGRMLLSKMVESERWADSFATIALEDHWSPWFKKWQMEKLGFKPVKSIKVRHKIRHVNEPFRIYLMWMPVKQNAVSPNWDEEALLKGADFCMAHPLYRPERMGTEKIMEKIE